MARKGDRYSQTPTLWYLGWGYPCHVMRRRRVRSEKTGRWTHRWENRYYHVLTLASAQRWWRLTQRGRAYFRRDVNREAFMQCGIIPIPRRAEWAGPKS